MIRRCNLVFFSQFFSGSRSTCKSRFHRKQTVLRVVPETLQFIYFGPDIRVKAADLQTRHPDGDAQYLFSAYVGARDNGLKMKKTWSPNVGSFCTYTPMMS